jgi:processive 1,2-diacylglycerol beta-glucosyltransferase
MLQDYQPDLTVCTHFLPAGILSWLTAEDRIANPPAIVVTDFDVHAMWLCRNYAHYFVALDETREHLAKLGIDPARISVTGIPIDPLFAETRSNRAMREKHNLDPDRTTILVSAGGFGVGPMEHLLTALLDLRSPAQVVAICGRNAELKKQMEELVESRPEATTKVMVLGYTTEMHELMAASDILLGKPGGLTTSEALANGLVFVIVNPIPGQEERNSDHLLEQGVAIRCNNLPVLAYKIDRLLGDPERFRAMQAASRRMARPRASYEIVQALVSS